MIRPLIVGFATTFKHLFKKPITVNYPEQKVPMFPKYRGKQVLMRDENGLEKCVACGLCSVACPADAIYLEAAENDGTVQAGPRYASVYQIHKTRCIFCGYCEEACPVGAIFMGKDYELAVYSKDDFVWDKTDLLVPATHAERARDGRIRARSHPASLLIPASARTMQIGALGDIHGAFDTVQDIMARHPDVPLWVQVGDVASNDGEYFTPVRAALLDQGQQRGLRRHRERDCRALAGRRRCTTCPTAARTRSGRGASRRSAARSRRAGTTRRRPRCRRHEAGGGHGDVVKLGKSRDDKRRHFVRDEVLACKALTGIDVFLTHEAPRPFYPAGRRIDAGKTVINEVLASMRPRLHLFGHHHEFTDSVRQGVRSIGLDVVTKSYLLIDAETFRCERLDT